MSENIKAIICTINIKCDNNDFFGARRVLEFNIDHISKDEYYHQLNDNARALAKHVISERKQERHPFNSAELAAIHRINRYSSSFDIPMLKRMIRNSTELLKKPSIASLLNKDALYLLKTMDIL